MLNLLMYFYQVVIQEDEKMKKALSVLLTMGLTVSMLAGCGSNGAADNASAVLHCLLMHCLQQAMQQTTVLQTIL